jgi:hypothetical protein
MKAGQNTAPKARDGMKGTFASVAAQELQMRIAASGLGDALARMACELCLEDVSVEEAFQKIHESAIEKMVHMLDSTILADENALASCLETVKKESERVAWQALEKGTQELRDGLTILEEIKQRENGSYVN